MVTLALENYLNLIPTAKASPHHNLWISYDPDADVLYVNFKRPSSATDSDPTDDDIILQYEKNTLIGMTILHASTRKLPLRAVSKKRIKPIRRQ